MTKFLVTFVLVNFRTKEILPPKTIEMEHVNCLSALGKVAILSGEIWDHGKFNLVSISIEPTGVMSPAAEEKKETVS